MGMNTELLRDPPSPVMRFLEESVEGVDLNHFDETLKIPAKAAAFNLLA
jgi:hypothetical protein